MSPRANSLLIASMVAIPCLAYTVPCFGHNGRDEDAPAAATETYNAADALSCIEVSTHPRTGVRTYTQTCDIPPDPGRPGAVAVNAPMEHGVDFWVSQSFASGGGNYAPAPPAYSDSGYSDNGYSDSYVSDGYYGYGGYPAYGYGYGYGDGYGSGRPRRGHGGRGDHGDHGDHGGGGRPGRPGGGGDVPPASNGGYHLPPRSRISAPLPRGVGSPPPYYDPGVGAPPPDLRYNTRGGRRG
jgi:hypothetical protein